MFAQIEHRQITKDALLFGAGRVVANASAVTELRKTTPLKCPTIDFLGSVKG